MKRLVECHTGLEQEAADHTSRFPITRATWVGVSSPRATRPTTSRWPGGRPRIAATRSGSLQGSGTNGPPQAVRPTSGPPTSAMTTGSSSRQPVAPSLRVRMHRDRVPICEGTGEGLCGRVLGRRAVQGAASSALNTGPLLFLKNDANPSDESMVTRRPRDQRREADGVDARRPDFL